MWKSALSLGRAIWLVLCLFVFAIGGAVFGYSEGGYLGAITCFFGGAFVGLFIGVSFCAALELLT